MKQAVAGSSHATNAQRGPRGPRGPRGRRGPRGKRGLAGSRGATGLQGPKGVTGAKGDKGDKGDPTYKRTVLVSPVGTELQNGAALRNALAGITTASSSKRYLLKIEPGTYDLGTTPLTMTSYVDIEGSGAADTVVKGVTPVYTGGDYIGLINMAASAELRSLAVAATGGNVIAIRAHDPAVLKDVDISAQGTYGEALWVNADLDLIRSAVRVNTSDSVPQGVYNGIAIFPGMYPSPGDVDIRDSTVQITTAAGNAYAIYWNAGTGTTTVTNSRVAASTPGSAYVYAGSQPFHAAASQLVGAVSSGDPKCVGAYDASFTARSTTC